MLSCLVREWMCSKFKLEASHQERGAGLLLQWDCIFIRFKSSSCTSWYDKSIRKYLVFCAVNSPGHICYTLYCVYPVICVSYFSLFLCSLISYSRHMMEKKKSISFSVLSPHIYSVKLHKLILISPQILFPVIFNRHRVNALHITLILRTHFVANCIFLTFPSQTSSHKNNWGPASYVPGEDPEFCFLLLKLSKFISSFCSNADFALIFSAFYMLLVYMITY